MAEESIHKGHRERLKQSFLNHGLDGFNDIQALELLLFYSIPQRDTNPLAHALLERFGGLAQVLDAEPEELMKVSGLSMHSAALIALVKAMGRRYQVAQNQQYTALMTPEQVGSYLVPYFYGQKREQVYLLCMDAKCKVLSCKQVGQGGINSASVSPRQVVETALAEGATTVALAHNHPSGVAVPSREDVLTTQRIAAALALVEIGLLDHIVVADGDYVSMVESGYQIYPDNAI